MTIHLQKLSVGSETVSTLRDWQKLVVRRRVQRGHSPHHEHRTRMFPKNKDGLLQGGSIYWVIKGFIQCRNEIIALEETKTRDGRRACSILMKPKIILVNPSPRRAFQGWRYLKPEDAPKDISADKQSISMPPELRAKLLSLGVW